MAIQYVGGVSAGRNGNSNATTTQSLTGLTGGIASAPAAGDLVIVCCAVGSQGRNTAQAISGYSTLGTQLNASAVTYDSSMQVSYKVMTSTPDTSITIPAQGNVADGQAWSVMVFRGIDASTPFAPSSVSATGTATGRPNPAAITPSNAGSWIVCAAAAAAAATTTAFTFPTDLNTNPQQATGADTNDARASLAYYSGWTSGSYDPAAYTGGTTGANDSWTAWTMALKPDPAQTITQSSSFTNSNTLNYAHTITIDLAPSLFTNSNTLNYAHEVTQSGGSQDLTQSATYSNTNTFYTHTQVHGLTQTAWDSGNPWFDLTTDSANTWATYPTPFNEQVFYKPTITQVQTLSQSARYDSSNTLNYEHTVTTGEVTLTQSSTYTNSPTYYTHTLTIYLTPDLYTNSPTFYTHSANLVLTQGTSFTNANGFYTHSLSLGLNQGTSYTNSNTFYTHNLDLVLTQGTSYTNSPTFFTHVIEGTDASQTLTQSTTYTNAQTYYTHTLTPGPVTLTASLYTNSNGYYTHTITTGAVTLTQGTTYTNTQTFYTHTLTPGGVTLTASRYDNSNTLNYAHTVTPGTVTLTPSLYSDGDTFYTHVVLRDGYLEPELYTNTNTFYSHTVAVEQFLVPVRYDNVTEYISHSLYKQYPDPVQVRIGVTYGQPGLTFVGTNANVFDGSPKLDIISGKLVKPVTNKVVISLT